MAPFTWDADLKILSRVEQFAGQAPKLVRMSSSGSALIVEIDGTVPEVAARRLVERMLQLDIAMGDFHDYCKETDKLKHVPNSCQGRMLRSPTLYEDVLKVISTTNTTWAQTKAMVSRLVDNFGLPLLSDPSLRTFPTPEQLASVSFDDFAAKARMGYRSASVHKTATDIAEGRLDLESWSDPSIPSDDLYKRLLSLPGIGPYAASCLLIYLGRYHRVNVDSWARTLVGKEMGRKVTDKEVHEFFEPYGKWRALVYHFYPWRKDDDA